MPPSLPSRLHLSRRRFLTAIGGTLGWSILPRLSAASNSAEFAFAEIPPSLSKITWVHDAGKSANKYLPESVGPGCAFLDYDNRSEEHTSELQSLRHLVC